MSNLADIIATGWERRAEIGPGRVDAKLKDAIERVIADLDAGAIRVAEKREGHRSRADDQHRGFHHGINILTSHA